MKLIIDIDEKDLDYPANILYAVKHGTPIPDNATVCDIEQIRADIEAARYGLINDGLDAALRIIDKHIEGRK